VIHQAPKREAFGCRDAPPRFIRRRGSRGLAPGWQTKGADIHFFANFAFLNPLCGWAVKKHNRFTTQSNLCSSAQSVCKKAQPSRHFGALHLTDD